MSSIAGQSEANRLSQSLSNMIVTAQSWPANWVAAGGLLLFAVASAIHGIIISMGGTLHFDLLEAYAWGKEFQLGYNQHGPFWAWIVGGWFSVFPVANWPFIVLEAINATLGLWGAWRLTGLFVSGRTRHAAVLLLLATPLYSYMAFKYNANTIFVSLWPWTLFYFVRSLDRMKARDAALFGVFAAACMLSKYYTVILLASCGLSLFFHPNGRKYIFSPLPWLAAAIFAVLVMPHAIWALTSDAPPVAYAIGLTGKGWVFTLEHAARFILDSTVNFAGVLAAVALAWWLSKVPAGEPVERLAKSRLRFLAVLVLAPLFLTIAAALAFKLKILAIMAVGIFPLMPLFLLQIARALDSRRCFQIAAAVAMAMTVSAIPAAPIERAVMHARNSKATAAPLREVATAATAIWHAEVRAPLRYAGGDAHYANAIAFYSDDHPSSFIDLSYAKSRWLTPEKLKKHGLLIACAHEDHVCLSDAAGLLSGSWKQFSISVGRTLGTGHGREIAFDIFVVPPQPA
jgi:4-amino-4-deoxy-L-arabinose transferase-like glycosyltransferase